ncbi:MAG: diacylglycerol/lipid kinase family protein [Bacteroidales bacterium]
MNRNRKYNAETGWVAIINPNAGRKKAAQDRNKIHDLLLRSGLSFQWVLTTHREHAIALTTKFIKKGFRKFLVIGGDGTLNEVVNGIFFQKAVPSTEFLVGMIPVGTGNDWCRMFEIPVHYDEAVEILKQQNIFLQDIARVEFHQGGKQKRRYFINVAGMGYDAEVAAKTNKDKEHGKGGPLLYLKNLFTSLLFYKHTNTKVVIDNQSEKPLTTRTFSMSIGICRYNGGGMMQLPSALPDDGLLNATLIKKIGKLTVLKEVKNLFDGSFVNHPKVLTFTGKSFKIDSSPPINLEADGESLGHSPFYFEVIPAALHVVVGKSSFTNHNQVLR